MMQIQPWFNARDILISISNDFQNDYASVQGYAESNGLTDDEAGILLRLAQVVRSHPSPES